MVEPKDTYQKPYKMRSQGRDGLNTVVSLPPAVIEREARKRKLTIQEFLERFVAIAQYDNFDGVFYTFKPANKGNNDART